MAKQLMVVSTLTASVRYQEHARTDSRGAAPEVVREVLVKGGAGLADRFERTVGAVSTPITPEDAEFLRSNRQFKKHAERGFVKIVEVGPDPEAVATEMERRDKSSPLTESDIEAKGAVKVKK